MKAAEYSSYTEAKIAFVATNSICQGQQVAILWPTLFKMGLEIAFAHTGFKWANLAGNNAGVTVVIVGLAKHPGPIRKIYSSARFDQVTSENAPYISAYLVAGQDAIVHKCGYSHSHLPEMKFGNKAVDGGYLLMTEPEVTSLGLSSEHRNKLIRRFFGSAELIKGIIRYCIWIMEEDLDLALQ